MTEQTHHHHHRTHHRHPHAASPEGVGAGPAEAQACGKPEGSSAKTLVTDVADASISPAERKAQLLERIERQRLLRQTRRIQAAISALQAKGQGDSGSDTGFPRSKTLRLITGQPLLAAGAVGVVLMLGPARLMRLASWVVPMLLRRSS